MAKPVWAVAEFLRDAWSGRPLAWMCAVPALEDSIELEKEGTAWGAVRAPYPGPKERAHGASLGGWGLHLGGWRSRFPVHGVR